MSITIATDGAMFLEAMERYAGTIRYIPLEWWPDCLRLGLGVPRKRPGATVTVSGCPNGLELIVTMGVELEPGALLVKKKSVPKNRWVGRPAGRVNEALNGMRGYYAGEILRKERPEMVGLMIVWDNREGAE